jgi:2Fe-2S ferredoxin
MKIQVIDREGKPHSVDWEPGQSLMELLRDNDSVLASCGGQCLCSTCHVYFEALPFSTLPPPSSDELERLHESSNFREKASRLSCQIPFSEVLSGATIVLAPFE